MVLIRLIPLLVLLACERAPSRSTVALAETCMCPCACVTPDAAAEPDAPEPDAAPPPIDLAVPWTRHVITPGAPTGAYRGADGVAEDVDHCWSTAWEEGGSVTRACFIDSSWQTELVATGLVGAEDAKAGDIDGDGAIDVVTASDGGSRVYVTFRGTPSITITLTASMGHGRVMQIALVDMNGDANLDIVMGTRVASPAVVAWLENPGPANARLSVWWTYHEISQAGWVMSLVPRDFNGDGRMDVLVSDRAKLADGTYGLYGSRWMEQLSDGTWMGHTIAGGSPKTPAVPYQTGQCSPYALTTCERTPSDEMFAAVLGNDVYDCTSTGSQVDSRISIHHTEDWLSWTHTTLPPVANVGHCQGVLPMDVDLDGDIDLVVTTWKGNAYPVTSTASGVYWLRAPNWERGEISGPEGAKFDNALARGRCIVTSEQLDPEGGFGVVEFCPP